MTTPAKKTTAAKTTRVKPTPPAELQSLREIWTPDTVRRTIREGAMDIAAAVAMVAIVKHAASFTDITLSRVIQDIAYRKMWKQ